MAKSSPPVSDPEAAIQAFGNRVNIGAFDVESYVFGKDEKQYVYHWVNKKDTRVARKKMFGWEVVSYHQGHAEHGGQWNEGAGAYLCGDLILMRVHRDNRMYRMERELRERKEKIARGEITAQVFADAEKISREHSRPGRVVDTKPFVIEDSHSR